MVAPGWRGGRVRASRTRSEWQPAKRPRRLDIPICKIVGINPEVSNVKFNRPDFQKTLGFPHEQAVVAFRPLRVVPADIEDMPSFDQGQRPSLMSLSRVSLPSV